MKHVTKVLVSFKFVAVKSNGDIIDPDGEYKTMHDLGAAGYEIAAVIPGSEYFSFPSTLIMQRRDGEVGYIDLD